MAETRTVMPAKLGFRIVQVGSRFQYVPVDGWERCGYCGTQPAYPETHFCLGMAAAKTDKGVRDGRHLMNRDDVWAAPSSATVDEG